MKKFMPATTFVAFPLLAKTIRLRTYGCIAIVLLAGCTATQVRWDATKMREGVMVYYNDQIMDNLIKAKNHLPFVHVDITALTSQGASQITGTIGAGETRTNTNASKSMAGALGTITQAVMRPFAYSVSPQQTETLTISAAPALGSQALVSPTPEPNETAKPTPTPEVTKTTITYGSDGNETSTTEEETLKPTPTPNPVTLYELYEKYAKCPPKGVLSESSIRPREGTYVPGTLKRWSAQYYYIANNSKDKKAYYTFCKRLFTKGQAGSLERALQQTQAASLAVPAR